MKRETEDVWEVNVKEKKKICKKERIVGRWSAGFAYHNR